jgi:FkbM family methyltransferase
MFSYAQNLEDVRIALCFGKAGGRTYVDVGGGHPVADNATYMLYLQGWSGLVVEPQPDLAALYAPLRPRDTVVATLVGREEADVDFHVIDRLHGLSSMLPAQAIAAREWGADHRVERRRVTTLTTLLDRAGITSIDVLKVDVEGVEPDVLAGLDFTRFRPVMMVIEAIFPGHSEPDYSRFEPMVTDLGYVRAHYDGLNVIYVVGERPELIAAFTPEMEAEAQSSAALHRYGRAAEDKTHPDHAAALALSRGLLARLPYLSPDLLDGLLPEGAPAPGSDDWRAMIGRICCGTDGGKIHWD